MDILVVDVGGHSVKMKVSSSPEIRRFPSGPALGAAEMVEGVRRATADWSYQVVTVGYPGLVRRGKAMVEPGHLGPGWVGFDLEAAFGVPVKLINDAAMQALGSYEGGRMLFLGLGTGLGSAMISEGVVEPMELASLPYQRGTFQDYVGRAALKRLGRRKWQRHVERAVQRLAAALLPDYVVLGGGNVKKLEKLPLLTRPGNNANAFIGGVRLWDETGEFVANPFGRKPYQPDELPSPPHLRIVGA